LNSLSKFILLSFLILASTFANRLKLKKADILESKTIGKESVKYLKGNVEFQKGLVELKCQYGTHREKQGIAYLFDNVSVTKETLTLTCDSISFYSKEDRIESTGNPKVQDLDYSLNSDTLIYFTEADSGVALGRVELFQNNQKIRANRIEYKKQPGSRVVSYTAIGDVIIEDSVRIATCGMATYNHTDEKTILDIKPKIIDEARTLFGKKIIMSYKEKKLKKIFIPNNAQASTVSEGYQESKNDTSNSRQKLRFNDDMTSTSLEGYFDDGKLDSLRLRGMASTLYHIFEDSLYKGKNETSGDVITMNFIDKQLNNIFVSGGSQGKYVPDTISNNFEYPLIYSAEKIDYHLKTEESELIGNAKAHHENTDLEAGYIKVNWPTKILNAHPRNAADSTYKIIKPTIIEKGRDPMVGNEMIYNLETKRGKIIYGKTKSDDGYYKGKEIRNESDEIIYIKNSIFTTCDLDTPHFHFESSKMKIIQNDVVIAKPIVLKIAEIPVAGIPLAIFPHQGGRRHSGWIMPAYGESRSRGQYIDGLGYYWAPNDYWDSKFTLSFGDQQGAVLNIKNQYRMRYKFSGSFYIRNQQFLSGSEDIISLKENRNSNFMFRWNHAQVLKNNQTFNANTTYSSNGNYNRKYGLDIAQRMDQKATSNVTYTKRWSKSKNSISLNLFSNQDLLIDKKTDNTSNYFITPTQAGSQLNIINRTLPKISFRHGQSNLIPTKNDQKQWYNNITWNYGFNFTNKDRKYYESVSVDSLNNFDWKRDTNGDLIDTVFTDNGWTHTASINAPTKLFKYITVNPSVNLRSSWVNRTFDKVWDDSTNNFQNIEKNGFATRTTGSFSVNANTKLYGVFVMPFGPLKVIRHVASPSIGFSWTPDFSKPLFGNQLGYIETYTNPNGNEIVHDRFSGTMAGSTPNSEQKNINFSLNNIFQAKTIKDEEEKKIDLFSWRMSSSYNFAADKYKLANLRSSVRSKLFGKLNLDLSMTHDFYGYNEETGARVTKYNLNKGGIVSPRLTNARLSTGFRLNGNRWQKNDKKGSNDIDSSNTNNDLAGPGLQNPIQTIKNTLKGGNLWSTNLSISYSYNAYNPLNKSKTFWVNTSSNIQVSKYWKLAYRARFDMIEKDLVSHNISLNRDLHCWELSLNWTPGGIGQGVYVRLNVKSPTLKDLKIEKKGGVYSKSPF
tara:strand:+ start:23 stop:3553 length:3531 start_codon:yes stop_codon:yes gene_type:complete